MQIKRVLVTTDLSAVSEHAIEPAIALAGQLGAETTILYVHRPPVLYMPDGLGVPPRFYADLAELARRDFEALVERHRPGNASVHAMFAEGEPITEIDRIASGFDLVVVCTHGRTGLRHLLIGSVAERVVRTCPVPVLTIHPPPEA